MVSRIRASKHALNFIAGRSSDPAEACVDYFVWIDVWSASHVEEW